MTVNSYSFLFFFIVVFAVYHLPAVKRSKTVQNTWLLLCSYVFYAIIDWKMLALLFGATVIFFFIGKMMAKATGNSRERLASHLTKLGVGIGVGILLFFKYLDFFAEPIAHLLNGIGLQVSWTALHILIPVGVSFFTFKLISYVVEIHRERIRPSGSFVDFAAYISFFPTILSGPIDTPNKFLPQLSKPRSLDYELAADGCRQILWGMLLKMVVADKMAQVTNMTWDFIDYQSASTLLVVALLYPIQLYADFSSYSDMAIGVGKLLGFRVERNFNHPLLARNVAEYWRRWHMSLTNWITNYIFMPLSIRFRNIGMWGLALAVIINLVVIGLWHGANWTFAAFGLYHGLLFVPLIFIGSFAKNKKLKPFEMNISGRIYKVPKASDLMKMIGTFCLVSIGLVFFRAPDMHTAFHFFESTFDTSILSVPSVSLGMMTSFLVIMMIALEWICRNDEHPLQTLKNASWSRKWLRLAVYYLILLVIFRYQAPNQEFIYFQF